jgi:hypothetical protein
VALERGYPDAADPAAALEAIDRVAEDLWRAAASLGGLEPGVRRSVRTTYNVYEDVALVRSGEGGAPELLHLAAGAAAEMVRSATPLVRMAMLYDRRSDLRQAMGSFAAERWPGRREVAVLEFFRAFQPMWQSYLEFHSATRFGPERRLSWNPLGLPAVDALARARAAVWAGLAGCSHREEDAQRVSVQDLHALLDREGAPASAGAVGACLFVQPASADGRLWVLNQVKEGTGRFGSRYTPIMDPDTRHAYTGHLAARGLFQVDGEPAELLDLRSVHGDTVNVHAPHTPAVLMRPGDPALDPPLRQVEIRDLRISFEDGGAVLRGSDGRRYVAVHAGAAYEDFIPPFDRFLAVFGPGEMVPVLPPPRIFARGAVREGRRMVMGNLVLHRRHWTFEAPALARSLDAGSEPQAFAAVTRWRAEHGIPDRVFLIEPIPHPAYRVRYSPQYLDFTSPLFVSLFRAVLRGVGGTLRLVEALPTAGMFPRDAAGRSWAVELLLDTLALRLPCGSAPSPVSATRADTTPSPHTAEGPGPGPGGVRKPRRTNGSRTQSA